MLAAWFVVLTTRWPRSRFFPRALGAVAAPAVIVGTQAIFLPGSWSMVNWLITEGMMRSVSLVTQVFMVVDSDVSLSTAQLNTLYDVAEQQGRRFTALLGLSCVAGLGVAGWAEVGRRGGG